MELTDNINATPQGQNNAGTEPEQNNTEKTTFTKEEVELLLQKETDRRVSQALATQERKTQAKLREAEKLASMTAEEKYKYELDQREQAIAEKEHQLLLAENRAEASKILADKGLSQTFLDFVIADTADEMNERISKIDRAFKECVKAEVEKRLGSNTPKMASSTRTTLTKEQFAALPVSRQQEIARQDRELYNSLVS